MKVLCVVLLLVGLCVASRPSPPAIPSTFHARVRAIMYSGSSHHKDSWKGAGLFALDVEKGFARTDIHLWGDKEPTRFNIHTLDRYDVEETYVIDNHNQKCQKKKTVGKLANPLLWVQNSTFAGESEYLGQTLENFEFQEGSVYYKIAVKKGTNEPVIFTTRSADSEMVMTVKEWSAKASPQWARYIPSTCVNENNIGDIPGVVYFANNNWDCYDVACDQTVPAGSGQPNYACAEFVARCEAYGGFIPNIGATDPQGSYYSYSYNGNSYDLCWCSDLSSALGALGFSQLSAAYSSVDAGVATFGDGGDGYFSHAVIGVGPQTVDAHNNARLQIAVSDDLINGVDAAWAPPGSPPSTGSSTGTGSYYSTQMEAASQKETFGGEGFIYNKGEKISAVQTENEIRLVEEKAAKKF